MSDCDTQCTNFTDVEAGILEIVNVLLSTLSFLGSIFIIYAFWRIKKLRSFAFRLVFWTAVADLFFSLGGMLGDAGGNEDTYLGANPGLCFVQATLISYFQLASLIWSTSIGFTLHMGFLKRLIEFSPSEVHKYENIYHMIAWGLPLVLTFLPFITNSYGDDGGWCWIQTRDDHYIWRFVLFYIFLCWAVLYNCYVYFKVWKKIQPMPQSPGKSKSQMAGRLKFYPLVLVLCHSAGFFVTFQEALTGGTNIFWLTMLQAITSSLQGLANALIYGLTADVLAEIHTWDWGCLQNMKSKVTPVTESDNKNTDTVTESDKTNTDTGTESDNTDTNIEIDNTKPKLADNADLKKGPDS